MRWWKLAAIGAPLAAAGGFGAALVWMSRRWIAPPRVRFEPPHPARAVEVSFPSRDGTPLAGWFLPGAADEPALILCHGYQRCMEETFSLGVEFQHRGYSVLLFDFRGCGRSGGRYTTIGDREPDDVLGAIAWLRRRVGPGTPIGLHGISMGGATAISAAARSPEVAAVVSDSAFAHLSGAVQVRFEGLRFPNLQLYRLSMHTAERMCGGRVARVRPVDEIARIAPRPLLLIHGTRDGIVPYPHFEELVEAAREPKQAWTVSDSTHAMARFDAPQEYIERVAAFFDEALRPQRVAVAAPA